MNQLKNTMNIFFKGMIVGAGTLVPGVSGGTTAMAVGCFETILYSVSSIFTDFKKSVSYLFPILFGAAVSIFAFSKPLLLFSAFYPTLSRYIFCLLSLISMWIFIKRNIQRNLTKGKFFFFIFGIISSVTTAIIIKENNLNDIDDNLFVLIFMGIFLSAALVLPAVSFSYMMLFLGIYEKVLDAVADLNFLYLLPLAFGILSGTLCFSKIFLKLIEKHNQETYYYILGFVICSVAEILV